MPKEVTKIGALLEEVAASGGSDLHLVSGRPPYVRIDGALVPTDHPELGAKDVAELVTSLLTPVQRQRLDETREIDFAYEVSSGDRFRMNCFWEKGNLGLAARLIPKEIPTLDQIGLTAAMKDLLSLPNGLILVTGPTGAGKSTTLAAMTNEINKTVAKNIVTLEDPIEFVYPLGKSLVCQREVGSDTLSFAEGLKHALRQDPNIILVGEMRDLETISTTLTLAETGHLVFATLHTNNAAATVQRMIDVFPEFQQAQVRVQLAMTLRAVISQQLFASPKGGRVSVREFMVNNSAVANLIRENKPEQISTVIQTSAKAGMFTLESDIKRLVVKGLVSAEDAARFGVRK